MAHELEKKGFHTIGSGINFNNPKYKVYYFEDSKELQNAINSIKEEKENASLR